MRTTLRPGNSHHRRLGHRLGAALGASLLLSTVTAGITLAIGAAPAGAALPVPVVIAPSSPAVVGPVGLVEDGLGNLYIANYDGNTISVLSPSGGTFFGVHVPAGVATIVVSTGLSDPRELALDGTGHLFVANRGSGTVSVLSNTATTIFGVSVPADTTTTLATGLSAPAAVAVDGAGNLYFSDVGADKIYVLSNSTMPIFGVTPVVDTPTLVASTGLYPYSIVFSAGKLYIGDADDNNVGVLSATPTTLFGVPVPADTVTTVASAGLNEPAGLAVDGTGDVFMGNVGGVDSLTVISPIDQTLYGVNVPANTVTTLATAGVDGPYGLTVDASGNLLFANYDSNNVSELLFSPTKVSGGGSAAALPPGAPADTYGAPTTVRYNTATGTTFSVITAHGTATVTVPPGALPQDTSLSLYPILNPAGITLPAGQSFVDSFAFSWSNDGQPPTVALEPITLTISDPNITTADQFFQETATGLVPVTGTATSGSVTFSFTTDPAFVITAPTTPPGPKAAGYDLVGSDGGVFVFNTSGSGFYGSLPGIGVHVHNIVGMVPTTDNKGYYLVGSDGGVFAFGDAPFAGSLPGIGVHVSNIVGIVPTAGDLGYFLVGSDGGVFSFGNAKFANSLPGTGVHVNNIVGIAVTPDNQGYWLVGSNGAVYPLGDAKSYGNAASASPIVSIASTTDGLGYWLAAANGGVFSFGDAGFHGSLPGIGIRVSDVVSMVPSADGAGYLLIGRDGGIFAFGDAAFHGSLPGIGVRVGNIVGAVPTV